MTTVLCVGDPHFKVDNISEVNLFIERLESLAKERNPTLIIILGDVLDTHERLHTTPLNKAYEFVDRMRKIAKTYVLVGNHDMCNNQQFLTENHWMNAMKEWENVVIVDKVIHVHVNKLHFVMAPYVFPGRMVEALNTSNEDWKKAQCLFVHQEFYGCKMGAIVSVEGDRWHDDYPEVVSGHIHSKQSPQKNIYYCGSSMQHAFGESEENIIPILKWKKSDEKYILEEYDLGLPRKRIIYTDITSLENYNPPETEDKIKITVSGSYDEFKALKKTKKYKELIKSGKRIVFKTKKLIQKDEEINESMDETDFDKILNSLIIAEKNRYLYQTFELVIKNKIINTNDVIFM